MGRKSNYTIDFKLSVVDRYLNKGEGSVTIGKDLNLNPNTVLKWVKQFQKSDAEVFLEKPRNQSYSKEFKIQVIEEYLAGGCSYPDLALKYNIPSHNTILQWVKKYSNLEAIKDYSPAPEVYMAKRIQTTFEQRMEAVQWYEENGRSYKDTAAHFGYNYAQVRDWVKKYESSGEDGLLDRRGQRKEEAELTETERLKRELILERNKRKRLEMENELLKKLNELERG